MDGAGTAEGGQPSRGWNSEGGCLLLRDNRPRDSNQAGSFLPGGGVQLIEERWANISQHQSELWACKIFIKRGSAGGGSLLQNVEFLCVDYY